MSQNQYSFQKPHISKSQVDKGYPSISKLVPSAFHVVIFMRNSSNKFLVGELVLFPKVSISQSQYSSRSLQTPYSQNSSL